MVTALTKVYKGGYGLIADVRGASTNKILARASEMITIGTPHVRNLTYEICDTWNETKSGGEGMTVDVWNISMIPAGAVFDLKFDMHDIPDQLFVEYPEGNRVLETGEQNYVESKLCGILCLISVHTIQDGEVVRIMMDQCFQVVL